MISPVKRSNTLVLIIVWLIGVVTGILTVFISTVSVFGYRITLLAILGATSMLLVGFLRERHQAG
jgi:hypothetical protein